MSLMLADGMERNMIKKTFVPVLCLAGGGGVYNLCIYAYHADLKMIKGCVGYGVACVRLGEKKTFRVKC